jgi:hypothetical protein
MQPARLCLAALVLTSLLAASNAHAALDTWAVLSSTKAETSNLADLVTVALSQDTTLRLVERRRILEVAKELALSTLLGSEGAGERNRLGRLLKADALVILGEETLDGKECVRLVIADTQCGARLRTDYFLPEAGAGPALADAIRGRVQETRARFADGIRSVFGVPPFVCRNLTHDYDGLQTGYACLLSEALMSLPGVAVIETAEAQQIGREIGVTGAPGVDRVVPLMIEGEYEVTRPPATPEPMVTIRLRISDGKGAVQTPAPRTLKLADVGRYLSMELPAAISRLSEAGTTVPLGADRQFAALAARAEEMARLGQWGLSTNLREAALLLKEADAPQRTALVDEYLKILVSPFQPPAGYEDVPGNKIFDRLRRERFVVWYACLRNIEYLIRNRLTTTLEGARITGQALRHPRMIKVLGDPQSAEAEQVKQRFMREVFPLALTLPIGKFQGMADWINVLREVSMERYDRLECGKDDLDRYLDLMENVMPENGLFAMFDLGPSSFSRTVPDTSYRTFTAEEYLAFVDRLKGSQRPVNVLIGRHADLAYRLGKRLNSGASVDDLLPQAEQLAIDFETLKPREGYSTMAKFRVDGLVREIRKRMGLPDRQSPLVTAPKAPMRSGPPMPWSLSPPAAPKPQDAPPPGFTTEGMQNSREAVGDALYRDAPIGATIKFLEVPLRIKTLSGHIVPYGTTAQEDRPARASVPVTAHPRVPRPLVFNRILACGDRFDVLWWRRAIFFLRQKGLAQVVFEKDTESFLDVRWDGQNVWIATRDEGVWVVSPAGKIVAKVGPEQGLPPATAMLMWPLAPGRVCVAGGSDRAWCAMVELAGGQPRVNVFHTATTIQTNEYRGWPVARDPTLAFIPQYIFGFRSARGDQDLLLVGRHKVGFGEEYPLQIDLRTLKVSVFDRRLGLVYNRTDGCFFSQNGLLFGLNDSGVLCVLAASGETLPDGKPIRYICRCGDQNTPRRIVPYRGGLYVLGAGPLLRIDPATLKAERFEYSKPNPRVTNTDVSALYGLVGWTGGTLYQAEITELTPTPSEGPAKSSTSSPEQPPSSAPRKPPA